MRPPEESSAKLQPARESTPKPPSRRGSRSRSGVQTWVAGGMRSSALRLATLRGQPSGT